MPVTFNPRTNKWDAGYTDQFGKRHRHGFETKKEAKQHLLQQEVAIRDRTYRPDAAKIKLGQVCSQFIESSQKRVDRKELEQTTHDNYCTSISLYVVASRPQADGSWFKFPRGHMPVGEIGETEVEEFRGHLVDLGLKPSTVLSHAKTLGLVLGFAKKRKLIAFNVTCP